MSHHILVVDDDAGIREIIRAVLEDEGLDVETAANGREALDRIAEQPPRLVLLDLQMPLMTGWEVLSQLREASVDVPIVFMTAGYRVQAEAARCGADGYLAKPFDIGQIIDVVERYAAPPA